MAEQKRPSSYMWLNALLAVALIAVGFVIRNLLVD
jgi:hypothetical protein